MAEVACQASSEDELLFAGVPPCGIGLISSMTDSRAIVAYANRSPTHAPGPQGEVAESSQIHRREGHGDGTYLGPCLTAELTVCTVGAIGAVCTYTVGAFSWWCIHTYREQGFLFLSNSHLPLGQPHCPW